MISASTIKHIQAFCRPAVDVGLIPQAELKAALKALRGTHADARSPREHLLLKAGDVATKLGVCPKTVLRLAGRGVLSRVYLEPGNPKSLRFRSAEVDAFVEGGGAE